MPTMMAKFDAVELTDEERNQAVLNAKVEKYYRLEEERTRNEKKAQLMELTRQWSVEEMKAYATKRANKLVSLTGRTEYVFDEFTTPVFELLALYFTGNEEFENRGDGYSLRKGLLLQGNVGVGKTDIVRAFEKNRVRCFATITANEVAERIKQNGADYWRTYSGFIPGHGSTAEYFFQPNIGWMIDDVGTEEAVNDYGTRVDPLPVIIGERYKLKDKIPFASLHITTNFTGDQIEQRYDYRFRSRIREMFNVIVLKGSDRRL